MSQGYIKPQYNDYEERKIERDLTPKEKKLYEQNPNLNIDAIKNLRQKLSEDNVQTKKSQAINYNFDVPNCSVYNKINSHNSNIFHNEVFI